MRIYYGRLFPAESLLRWLAYGNDSRRPSADGTFLSRRELCFTLEGDVFVRYLSFEDAKSFRAALSSRLPAKIDVGPVYSCPPARRALAGAAFAPLEREFVIDVDLTDYDDARTCGSGAHACARCWPLAGCAVALLDRALREDFGFRHILWVFSGRRGVHAWVCDQRARAMTDEQRAAVASYLSIRRGKIHDAAAGAPPAGGTATAGPPGAAPGALPGAGPTTSPLLLPNELPPSLERAAGIVTRVLEQWILPRQRLLTTPRTAAAVLALLPTENARQAVLRAWEDDPACTPVQEEGDEEEEGGESGARKEGGAGRKKSDPGPGPGADAVAGDERDERAAPPGSCSSSFSASSPGALVELARWRAFVSLSRRFAEQARRAREAPRVARAFERAPRDAAFALCYPRLDVEVSKKRNHLLKAPFCVHPKTGLVCVPIRPEEALDFDPGRAPNVHALFAQLDAGTPADQTDLAPYVRRFETEFLDPLLDECREKQRQDARAAGDRATLAW